MDGGAWWAAVSGITKSRTRLSDSTFAFHFHALEKGMATHASVLAWRIPGMGELVGCRLWGRRVGHDGSDLAAAAKQSNILLLACSSVRWKSQGFGWVLFLESHKVKVKVSAGCSSYPDARARTLFTNTLRPWAKPSSCYQGRRPPSHGWLFSPSCCQLLETACIPHHMTPPLWSQH